MIKNLLYLLLALLIGAAVGYIMAPDKVIRFTDKLESEGIKVTDREVRPDGSVTERIVEKVKVKSEVKYAQTSKTFPKRFIAIGTALGDEESLYQVELGYRVLPQLALKVGLIRQDFDYIWTAGLQMDF